LFKEARGEETHSIGGGDTTLIEGGDTTLAEGEDTEVIAPWLLQHYDDPNPSTIEEGYWRWIIW
jgi:hypothetical protein